MIDTEKIHDLLRRLIESFIDHPRDLIVDAKELPARIDWQIKVHADDMPKVTGKQGAHIKALQFIVAQFGNAAEEDYRLLLAEPDPAPRRPFSPEKRAADYDASDAALLLGDLLREVLAEMPRIITADGREGGLLMFKFQIMAESHQDYEALTVPFEDDASNMTLIAALGTIFRAYGNREGVVFKLETNE